MPHCGRSTYFQEEPLFTQCAPSISTLKTLHVHMDYYLSPFLLADGCVYLKLTTEKRKVHLMTLLSGTDLKVILDPVQLSSHVCCVSSLSLISISTVTALIYTSSVTSIIFFKFFFNLKCRVIEKRRHRTEIFYLLDHAPDGCNSQK